MNLFQLLSIEILVSFALICGIIMYNKPLIKSGVMVLTAPVSFIVTALIFSAGVLKFIGDIVTNLIVSYALTAELSAGLTNSLQIVSAMVTALANILLFSLFFWIIEIMLITIVKIIFKIINKVKAKKSASAAKADKGPEAAISSDKEPTTVLEGEVTPTEEKKEIKEKKNVFPSVAKKLASALMGVVLGVFLCVFTFYPMISVFNALHPAFERAWDENHSGSQISDIAHTVHDDYMSKFEDTVICSLGRIQPFSAMFELADHLLADIEITDKDGNKNYYNFLDTFGHLASDSVDIAAIYEYAMLSEDHTLSELALACDVLYDLAEHPELLTIASELVEMYQNQSNAENTDQEGMTNMFADLLLSGYTQGNVEALKNDIIVVANVLSILLDESEGVYINSAGDYVSGFVSDADKMTPLITELSHFNSYSNVITTLTEYIVNGLCNELQIYESEDEFKQEFLGELGTVMYDGKADIEALDRFVEHSVENKTTVFGYTVSNPEMPSPLDSSFIHCKEYIEDYKSIVSLFNYYYLNCDKEVYYYSKNSNTIYKYLDSEGYFVIYDGQMPAVTLVVAYMTECYSELPTGLTGHELVAMFKNISNEYLVEKYPLLDREYINQVCAFVDSISTFEERSLGIVTKDMVKNSLKNDISAERMTEQSDIFAELLMNVGVLITVSSEDGMGVNSILSNFGEVGKLVDVMCKLEYTEDLPEQLLLALAQNKNYRHYFDIESIQLMIENKKNDKSLYESVFTSIQALYQIANEIM